MMNKYAPIVVFLYNRPEHSKRTLDALALNPESKESKLFIYCDGAKKNVTKEQFENINNVRDLAKNENRFGSVTVIEQSLNKGLANSIMDGVTEIVNEFGRVIVLEDDLLVSKNFLAFMNEALVTYEINEEVACISGYVYPLKKQFDTAFFLKGADCWGWATWKSKWQLLERDAIKLKEQLLSANAVAEFNFSNSYPYFQMLTDRIEGKNQSWAILWYASAFLKNKYCLYPPYSLVHNIGNDGSGTHAVNTDVYNIQLKKQEKIIFPSSVNDNKVARKQFELFFGAGKISLVTRAKNKAKRIFKRLLGNNVHYGWSGDYASWNAAQKKCTGYDDMLIVNKVKEAVLKVKRGEAKYERDSVVFDEVYMFEPILSALKSSVHGSKLHICDFGGSLGSSYFQFRNDFEQLTDFKWTVIEQKHFVEIGKKEIAYENLHFDFTIDEALKKQSNQVLFLSSVLQYIPDAHTLIKQLLSYRFEYIIIDRTAIIDRNTDRIAIQIVPPDIYTASYPCWFFNENNFLHLFSEAYEVLENFTDEIPEPMMLDAYRVSWKGYYLKRKDV